MDLHWPHFSSEHHLVTFWVDAAACHAWPFASAPCLHGAGCLALAVASVGTGSCPARPYVAAPSAANAAAAESYLPRNAHAASA